MNQSWRRSKRWSTWTRARMWRPLILLVVGCVLASGSSAAQGRDPGEQNNTAGQSGAPPDSRDQRRGFAERAARARGALDRAPELTRGIQPLRTAAVGAYLSKMHRRMHKLWGFGVLEDWDTMKEDSPLNNPSLTTTLEIVLNSDGTVHTVTVAERSGYLPFDVAAIDVAYEAAPYPPLPPDMLSANGKGYMRWPFHRDSRQCSTPYVSFFVLGNQTVPGQARSTTIQRGIPADGASSRR